MTWYPIPRLGDEQPMDGPVTVVRHVAAPPTKPTAHGAHGIAYIPQPKRAHSKYSLALCRRIAELRATGLSWPEVGRQTGVPGPSCARLAGGAK